jgi:hypothetical protein
VRPVVSKLRGGRRSRTARVAIAKKRVNFASWPGHQLWSTNESEATYQAAQAPAVRSTADINIRSVAQM